VLISEILTAVRDKLVETTANFWPDSELTTHANAAVRDLWRAISDTHQDYFFTTSEAVTFPANTATLGSVPAGVAKVLGIEPLVQSSYPNMNFFPKRFTHPDMIAARAADAVDPASAGPTFYAITGAGGPVAAPTIYAAPKVTTAVALRLTYVPVCATLTASSTNPIPGESDDALIAYVIAHALAKERGDRKPDPDWLAKYATEKQNVLKFVTPRQEDEPDVAEAVFEQFTEG
jgi:hypothetical protein